MVRTIAIGATLSLAASAGAQERSDLMPAAPPVAPGAAMPMYPGQPMPAPAPAPLPGGIPAGSLPKPESHMGYVIPDDQPSISEAGGVPGAEAAMPEFHIVRRGDTLWDISQTYFHNPYTWPKLWSINPSITNPHWIFPGDQIRLMMPGGVGGPQPTPAVPEAGPRISGPARGPSGVFLRQTAFVEPGELKSAGFIIGSKEEKMLLATLDEAYVDFKNGQPMHVGERYSIYHPVSRIEHPLTHKYLGDIVQIFGECDVRAITDGKIARAAISDSTDPIERGFRVGPLRRQFKMMQPHPARSDLAGVVVATLRPHELVATDDLVFFDLGKQDGVELGTRFFVVRRGDGYQAVLEHVPTYDKRFPRENIAEIVVVDLRDHLATGMVINAVKEARVGDRVESRKGY
jgi:hypothetical protein